MAVVGGTSVRRQLMMVLPGGSSAELRGKTTSPCSGEAPGPVS
jgi:hypothetical protein